MTRILAFSVIAVKKWRNLKHCCNSSTNDVMNKELGCYFKRFYSINLCIHYVYRPLLLKSFILNADKRSERMEKRKFLRKMSIF